MADFQATPGRPGYEGSATIHHLFHHSDTSNQSSQSRLFQAGCKPASHNMTYTHSNMAVADEMKILGIILDRRLTFNSHATTVARACNYHIQAIRHIRQLLTTELALTLACTLILSRLDYCNAVLHGAPAGSIQKLQRVQNTAARVVLQVPRRSSA